MDTFSLQDLLMLFVVVGLIGLVSAIGPTIWRALPALVGRYTERRTVYDLVKTLQQELDEARAGYVAQEAQTSADRQQTDRQTSVSLDNPKPSRLKVDRTRNALIEELVYNGWGVGEIRAVIKGDNSAIGAEVEAARQRLGIVEAPRVIPVSERGSEPRPLVMERPKRFYDDPELEYKAPA